MFRPWILVPYILKKKIIIFYTIDSHLIIYMELFEMIGQLAKTNLRIKDYYSLVCNI